MVATRIAIFTVVGFAGNRRKRVPDALAAPIDLRGTFNLVTRGGGTPDEIFRKLTAFNHCCPCVVSRVLIAHLTNASSSG